MARLNEWRRFGDKRFHLSERLDDYRTAALAQAEYWAEGLCCRKIPVVPKKGKPYWEIWVGPERKYDMRLLPGEVIRRQKNIRILGVA